MLLHDVTPFSCDKSDKSSFSNSNLNVPSTLGDCILGYIFLGVHSFSNGSGRTGRVRDCHKTWSTQILLCLIIMFRDVPQNVPDSLVVPNILKRINRGSPKLWALIIPSPNGHLFPLPKSPGIAMKMFWMWMKPSGNRCYSEELPIVSKTFQRFAVRFRYFPMGP